MLDSSLRRHDDGPDDTNKVDMGAIVESSSDCSTLKTGEVRSLERRSSSSFESQKSLVNALKVQEQMLRRMDGMMNIIWCGRAENA